MRFRFISVNVSLWPFGMSCSRSADCPGACERSTMKVQFGLATVPVSECAARHSGGKQRENKQCGDLASTHVGL